MTAILDWIRPSSDLSREQATLLFLCLCASFCVIVIPLLYRLLSGLCRLLLKRGRTSPDLSGNGLLLTSLALLFSVWALRFAVGCYGTWFPTEDSASLTAAEELFNSFVHALQTFSMDEDYTAYITTGKKMMGTLFAGNEALCDILVSVYGIYAAVLNAVVPVAGGAIIFEIVAGIFPHFRLRGAYCAFWRPKYFFSELNESSLALMKSIRSAYRHKWIKPVLIVTDAFVDSADEKKTEMLQEARACYAICLKDDIAHVMKPRFGGRKFFLVDASDTRNLQALVNLSQGDIGYLRRSEILLFIQTDVHSRVEKSVSADLVRRTKDTFLWRKVFSRLSEGSRLRKAYEIHARYNTPIITPVKIYRNLVWNLLYDLPLYQPLIGRTYGKREGRELNVVILGTGYIGTEMFLSTYWCGQMLDCKLNITVVSRETREEFRSKINYINPEILKTVVFRDEDGNLPPVASGDRNPLLYVSREEDAPPYAYVQYVQEDINSDGLYEVMEKKADENTFLFSADYFLVSLGSDEINLSVADKLRETLGRHHLEGQTKTRSIIAYVVYDPALARTLNRTCRYDYSLNQGYDVYMRAIGSLADVYSVENILMPTLSPLAEQIHGTYLSKRGMEYRRTAEASRKRDEYNHWSSVARALHTKYKMFCLDLYKQSVFSACKEDELLRILAEDERVAAEAYRKYAIEGHYTLHDLAWLEHRRWNAFLRSSGFCATDLYPYYFSKTGTHKYIDLKLHPCLVECDSAGARVEWTADGTKLHEHIFDDPFEGVADLLDRVSQGVKQLSDKQRAEKKKKAEEARLAALERGEKEPPRTVPGTPGPVGRWIGRFSLGKKLLSLFYVEEADATYYSDYKIFDYPTEDIQKSGSRDSELTQILRTLFEIRRKEPTKIEEKEPEKTEIKEPKKVEKKKSKKTGAKAAKKKVEEKAPSDSEMPVGEGAPADETGKKE